jgi:hypothetical protein
MKMGKLIYQTMFEKLHKLGIIDHRGYPVFKEHVKLVSKPFMDLSVDNLGAGTHNELPVFRISMAHNFIQNGDLMADPDMEIRIYPYAGFVESLTYQQDSLGIYQVVYPEPGKEYPKLKKDLNRFLNQWLSNLIEQGFYLPQKPEDIEPPKLTPIPDMTGQQVETYREECRQNRIKLGIEV